MNIISIPFGYVFKFLYSLIQNYGFTIIVFTLLVKFAMFPLTIKQQRSLKKTQMIQPKLTQLQEKYKYDQQKLSIEMQKLYKEEGVNPMGGCLPLLIQFPILIALYNIIRKPLSFVYMLSADGISTLCGRLGMEVLNTADFQLNVARAIGEHFEKVSDLVSEAINFNFFGLDLSLVPSVSFITEHPIYVLFPLLAGGTTYLVSAVSMRINRANQQNNASANQAADSMKMMNVIFPFMTAWFSVTLPAGMGLYWTVSNLFQIGQTIIMDRYIKVDAPKEEAAPHFRTRKKKKK